jgi:hypothetical protein
LRSEQGDQSRGLDKHEKARKLENKRIRERVASSSKQRRGAIARSAGSRTTVASRAGQADQDMPRSEQGEQGRQVEMDSMSQKAALIFVINTAVRKVVMLML